MQSNYISHVLWRCLQSIAIILLLLFAFSTAVWLYQYAEKGSTELNLDKPDSFVLTNVNVLSLHTHQIVPSQALIVREGVISRVVPMAEFEAQVSLPIIDGEQAYVMPGLIDAHVHVLDRSYAKSALAAGVTTVRNMGGYSYHLKWRGELNAGEWFGSQLVLSSPIFNSVEQGDRLSQIPVDDPNHARQLVRDCIAKGYDFIKVYEGLNAQTYTAILDEASELGVMVAGHPSYDLMSQKPDAHGALRTFEHAEEIYDGFLKQTFDNEKAEEAARFFVQHDVALVPTLAVNRELTRLSTEKEAYLQQTDQDAITPFARYIYEQTSFKRWLGASPALGEYNLRTDNYFHYLTKLMYEREVRLVLGSDAGALTGLPGPATIDEIELMVAAAIPVNDVLLAATENAAYALGKSNEVGRIEAGMQADLLLLESNPLTSLSTLRSPKMVIQKGRVFDQNDLMQLRKEAHQHSDWLLSVSRHVSFLLFGW